MLLLSEIDLSVGYTAAVGAFTIAELIAPPVNLPWWLGIIGGLIVCAGIGGIQGTLITRLSLPSFIVTLGGLLGLEGVMLELANVDKTAVGGVIVDLVQQPGRPARASEHERGAELDRAGRLARRSPRSPR